METLNESVIKKIVAETLRRVLSENLTGEYRTKGSLNKKTIEKQKQAAPVSPIGGEEDFERNPEWDESMDDILSKFDDGEQFDDSTAGGEYQIDYENPYFFDKSGKRVDADVIGQFHNDFAIVKKGGKVNYINSDGQAISDEWFDACNDFEGGFGLVISNGKRNFVDQNGELLLDDWADRAGDFIGETAPVIIGGELLHVDKNGVIK